MENNIYEWIYLSRQNDEEALTNLIQYFRPSITQIWADLFLRADKTLWMEKDDFFQVADEVLYNCTLTYRSDLKRPFQSFYKQCIKNKGRDYRRLYVRDTYGIFYKHLSLDSKINEESQLYYANFAQAEDNINDTVIHNIYMESLINKLRLDFDEKSIEVILMKLDGCKPREICQICEVTTKFVSKTWKNFKKWFMNIDSLTE